MGMNFSIPASSDDLAQAASDMLHEGRLLSDLAQQMRALENMMGHKVALVHVEDAQPAEVVEQPRAETLTDPQPAPEPEQTPVTAEPHAAVVPEPINTEWTDDQIQKVVDLRYKGYSPTYIAKDVGHPLGATRALINRIGAKPRKPQKTPVALTTTGRWSADDLRIAVSMRADGKTLRVIGEAVGRSAGAVKLKLMTEEALVEDKKRLLAEKMMKAPASKSEPGPPAPPTAQPEPAPTVDPALAPELEARPIPVAQPASAPRPATVIETPAVPSVPSGLNPRLTSAQQVLVDHLGRLDDTFEPGDDLYLAESLAKGQSIDLIADQLGCDPASARKRYRSMLTEEITCPRGAITIGGQANLLAALRYRAAD